MGSFLDPLADKILVTTMYLSLTTASLMPAPLTALIISRDVLLVYAGLYIRYMSVKPPVSFFLIFFTRNTKYPVPLRNFGILGSKCSDTNANYLYQGRRNRPDWPDRGLPSIFQIHKVVVTYLITIFKSFTHNYRRKSVLASLIYLRFL